MTCRESLVRIQLWSYPRETSGVMTIVILLDRVRLLTKYLDLVDALLLTDSYTFWGYQPSYASL